MPFYQNFDPQHPDIGDPLHFTNNASWFVCTRFVVDNDYRGEQPFYTHAMLWQVDGIPFTACTFENLQTTDASFPSTHLGMGIFSLDANFRVNVACSAVLQYVGDPCPEENWVGCVFRGLNQGIHAMDGGSGRNFFVTNALFENNVCGVLANGIPGPIIHRNRFTIGGREAALDGPMNELFQGHHRGIFSYKSTGARIDQNVLVPADVPVMATEGIVINGSEASNSWAYKNSCTDLDRAYIAEGVCHDIGNPSVVGHEFICNTNSGNGYNFIERVPWDEPQAINCSMRIIQGSQYSPAGNTFDKTDAPLDETDFFNAAQQIPLEYWYDPNDLAQAPDHNGANIDVTPSYFFGYAASAANSCPDFLITPPTGDGGIDIATRSGLHDNLTAARTNYLTTAYAYYSLVDGGNTEAVVSQVMQTWPQDAWELRNTLMAESPFLSTRVLREMIERNVMPEAMELEVCLANPEATKLDGFVKWVTQEAANPLPMYAADLIEGSWDERSFRNTLLGNMAEQHSAMGNAANLLLAHLKCDTVHDPVDSLLAIIDLLPNYGACWMAIQTLLENNDFNTAQAAMVAMADDYPMRFGRDTELERASDLIDLFATVHTAGRSLAELTPAELSELKHDFAECGYDKAATWAQNILCFHYQDCLPISTGDVSQPRSYRPSLTGHNDAPKAGQLYPNPADEHCTLWSGSDEAGRERSLRVVDAASRTVMRLTIPTGQRIMIFDTRSLASGTYTVVVDGENGTPADLVLIVRH